MCVFNFVLSLSLYLSLSLPAVEDKPKIDPIWLQWKCIPKDEVEGRVYNSEVWAKCKILSKIKGKDVKFEVAYEDGDKEILGLESLRCNGEVFTINLIEKYSKISRSSSVEDKSVSTSLTNIHCQSTTVGTLNTK